MKPPQKRFTKGAAIYKSEKFVGIEGLSGSNALKYREDDGHMIYLEPDATNEVLGRSLLTALEKAATSTCDLSASSITGKGGAPLRGMAARVYGTLWL
jgi:hypothetical protein